MKKLFVIFVLLFLFSSCHAQSLKMEKTGEIKKTEKVVKKSDAVYKIVEGITVYKGANGALYYWKTSKKSGEKYKCYLKPK